MVVMRAFDFIVNGRRAFFVLCPQFVEAFYILVIVKIAETFGLFALGFYFCFFLRVAPVFGGKLLFIRAVARAYALTFEINASARYIVKADYGTARGRFVATAFAYYSEYFAFFYVEAYAVDGFERLSAHFEVLFQAVNFKENIVFTHVIVNFASIFKSHITFHYSSPSFFLFCP